MKQTPVVAAGLVLLALACTGCSARTSAGPGPSAFTKSSSEPAASAAPTVTNCASAGLVPPAASGRPRTMAAWPSRLLQRQRPSELIADQAISPATGAAYALISRTPTIPLQGPYVLECTELRTGSARHGPVFPVDRLTIAAGYLWVYGAPRPGAPPLIYQVNPVTLARIRSIPLPGPAGFGGAAFATGAGGSVWIGSYRTVLQVAVATGTTLRRVTLPPGLAVSGIAVDPAATTLYVSAAHVAHDGGASGLVMFEYNARSGRRLAAASSGLLRYSAAGAALTAVPGGVWASFRTGMMGLTLHLSRAGLQMITPPGPRITRSPATGIFHWPMYEATAYGGGALWVVNQLRILACLDPRTGKVRASERVGQSLLAVDPATHTIYGGDPNGLIQITPPRRCWS